MTGVVHGRRELVDGDSASRRQPQRERLAFRTILKSMCRPGTMISISTPRRWFHQQADRQIVGPAVRSIRPHEIPAIVAYVRRAERGGSSPDYTLVPGLTRRPAAMSWRPASRAGLRGTAGGPNPSMSTHALPDGDRPAGLVAALVALYLHLWKAGFTGPLTCTGNRGCEIAMLSRWGWFLGVDVA
jgi:hypothetical protein